MREIVFDTETTGLSPQYGDRMVEIGCVELYNRVETGRTFHSYFNPGRPMPSEAEAVHGLNDRFLSDKPLFPDVCEALIDFIGDSPLVAHNAGFDFGFINHEFGQCGRPAVCPSRMVDTLAIARQRFPGAKHSLDALCTRFGVARHLALGIEIGMEMPAGFDTVEHLHTADLDHAVTFGDLNSGGFGIENDFTH